MLAFFTCYFIIFFGGGVFPVGDLPQTGDVEIYVKSNGVHTDLCLPVENAQFNWKTMVNPVDFPHVKNPQFMAVGWGDKGFFLDTPTWNDLTFKTAFTAAFLPSETAMHVAYLENKPTENENCARVFLTKAHYEKLIVFVKNSFKTTDNNVILIPNKGYNKTDNFYEANGNYHLFKTCNAWTNNALKIVNIRTGLYALSAEGIMRHLR